MIARLCAIVVRSVFQNSQCTTSVALPRKQRATSEEGDDLQSRESEAGFDCVKSQNIDRDEIGVVWRISVVAKLTNESEPHEPDNSKAPPVYSRYV